VARTLMTIDATRVKNLGGGATVLLPKLKITCGLLLLLYIMLIYFRFWAKLDLLQCVFFCMRHYCELSMLYMVCHVWHGIFMGGGAKSQSGIAKPTRSPPSCTYGLVVCRWAVRNWKASRCKAKFFVGIANTYLRERNRVIVVLFIWYVKNRTCCARNCVKM
jgi:hypothetical protein